MASIITATTTSGLTQSADNSGVLQLASGTGNLVTIPSVTGTAMVSGNMPTFSAYSSGSQTISNNSFTKVIYNNENWDTANCYDPTTNYRFTPNVAGYYQVNARWNAAAASAAQGELFLTLYKNGSTYKRITNDAQNSSAVGLAVQGSCLVNLNGTTDYIEIYVYQSSTANLSANYFSSEGSYFEAFLVRHL